VKGYLYFADFYNCNNILTGESLRQAAIKAVRDAGMAEVRRMYEDFPEHIHKTEYGESVMTMIIPLEQSHLAIHTWPAQKLVCVDLFTCGDRFDAKRAVNNLLDLFNPKTKKIVGFKRGNEG